jgi:hypothetical protein
MRAFRDLLGVLTALTVSAPCIAQSGALTQQERAEGEAKVQVAARYFARVLRDPASATFRSVVIQRRSGRIEVCGELNARNGYGGFTGYEPFAVVRDVVYVPRPGGIDFAYVCGNANSVIDTRDYSAELIATLRQ